MEKTNKIRYYLPAIIWALAIFIVSSIPNLSTPGLGISFSDKVAHLIEFGILGFLLTLGLLRAGRPLKNIWKVVITLGIAYAIFDEFHQYIVPGRYFEFLDLLADIIGAVLGAAIAIVVGKKFKNMP
jgi:VanZ family protein